MADQKSVPAPVNTFERTYTALEKMIPELERALPRVGLTADRLVRVALTSIRHNLSLLECDRTTLFGAVMQCAQLGLVPDGVLGHAHLVPFYDGKAGGRVCQLIIGYQGYIELARRSGDVESIEASVVYAGDDFEFAYGTEPFLRHVPNRDADRTKRDAVYAVLTWRGSGRRTFRVLWPDEVGAVKQMSQTGRRDKGPWVEHPDAMWCKTAVHRLLKYAPKGTELEVAVGLDELAQSGVDQRLGDLHKAPGRSVRGLTLDRAEDLKEALAERQAEAAPNGDGGEPASEGSVTEVMERALDDAEQAKPPNGKPASLLPEDDAAAQELAAVFDKKYAEARPKGKTISAWAEGLDAAREAFMGRHANKSAGELLELLKSGAVAPVESAD